MACCCQEKPQCNCPNGVPDTVDITVVATGRYASLSGSYTLTYNRTDSDVRWYWRIDLSSQSFIEYRVTCFATGSNTRIHSYGAVGQLDNNAFGSIGNDNISSRTVTGNCVFKTFQTLYGDNAYGTFSATVP